MLEEKVVEKALDEYGDMLRRICFVHLKKEADIEDVFQNVFLKYASNSTPFLSSEYEKAWLIRVTINECHSFSRKWFNRNVDLVEDFSMYGLKEEPTYPEVLEAVLKLKPNLKNVIYLYYYEGYQLSEIAEILNQKENTIYTWMHRAKKKLKEMLGDDRFE